MHAAGSTTGWDLRCSCGCCGIRVGLCNQTIRHQPTCGTLSEQLGADANEMGEYAARDETRREHLQVLCKEYRFRPYGPAHSPLLRRYLETEALSIDFAFTLVESAMEWLRQHRVTLPAVATLETVVRAVRSKVEREVYWRLFNRLKENQKTELNQLLELGFSRGSLLGWLRRVPRSCSAAGFSTSCSG
jgi:hypothetical protein